MSETEKAEKSSYYGDKKYRYLSKNDSNALKDLLPPGWPEIIIEQVKKKAKDYPRIPSDTHLYALVNGRVRDFTFMPLVMDLALKKKSITDKIGELTREKVA